MKEKNVPPMRRGELGKGDIWTWVAIDADSKLVPSWLAGQRNSGYAKVLIDDLQSRLANRIQLASDGLKIYVNAVDNAFGADVDYAMLVKLYGTPQGEASDRRYSPGKCRGAIKGAVCGDPDTKHVSTENWRVNYI